MTPLPPDWKPDDAAHAVRCLESWVKQGEELFRLATKGPWISEKSEMPPIKFGSLGTDRWIGECFIYDEKQFSDSLRYGDKNAVINGNFVAKSRSLVPALIEGIKMVLKELEAIKGMIKKQPYVLRWIERLVQTQQIATTLAQAYAPHMAEAGFEIPK